ncbi:MAG: helix-turn-helix transcriptional regulator [Candidatus Komeilibacteria bacterium]|nr:helix-turn-helix transcriptional regulator [Candidatus Komeilibacteria bacterium]
MKGQLSNNVNNIRVRQGMTQEELAQAVGVTRQTIIALEKGNYVPSVALAIKISNYFHQPVEKIFYYED